MGVEKRKKVYCVYVGKGEWPLFSWANDHDAPSGELQASLMWHEKWHDDMRKVRITVEEIK
jgi:hypothetical protein